MDPTARDKLLWDTAQQLLRKGPFEDVRFIDAPTEQSPIDLARTFDSVDSTSNRLVVLENYDLQPVMLTNIRRERVKTGSK